MTAVSVDLGLIADLALAEALASPARTGGRRAACHLLTSLTVPPPKTMAAARTAIASFGTEPTQAAAARLLGRLAGVAALASQHQAATTKENR